MKQSIIRLFLGAVALVPISAVAQAPCPLPPDLAAWSQKTQAAAAPTADKLEGAALKVGQAYEAALLPTPEVSYLMQPEKPGGSVSSGGMFALDIAEAGSYRIALDAGPWIDLLRDGQAVTSSAHAPGPACSTVRKTVDFPLRPGRYVVQVSASGAPHLAILVAREP